MRVFATSYLQSFIFHFNRIQRDYMHRKMAFVNLFKHLPEDPNGNFPYRWLQILDRLENTNAEALCSAIESHIKYQKNGN